MSESLVLELQRLASSTEERLSDLLRKALIVATKLGLDDFRTWIEGELEGYRGEKVPEYRNIDCHVCVQNPYHGLQPVIMPDAKIQKAFCVVPVRDSVGSLQAVIAEELDTGHVKYTLSARQEQLLRQGANLLDMPVYRIVGTNDLAGILDTVRTRLLQWSLKLEQEGILGEGMSFSTEEKEKAQTSQVINIENFSGILGYVSGEQISQNIQTQINKNDFSSLAAALADLGIAQEDIDQLKDALDSDPVPKQPDKFGPKVGKWLGTMVQKAAEGTLKVGVDVAGKVISEALLVYWGLRP